jgi:hypothetical protein
MTQPFARVLVDYLVRGQSRISWELARHFTDPDPATWSYTLQVAGHGSMPSHQPDGSVRTDDWADVGSAVVNAAQLTDSVLRQFGKTSTTAYRIKLVTPRTAYYSPTGNNLGQLDKRDWLLAQELTRKEQLLHRRYSSTEGVLLRRRRNGTPCTKCLDRATGEVTLSRCEVCNGTRYIGGYLAGVAATFCALAVRESREHRNLQTASEKPEVTSGRVLAVPGLFSGDLWVAGDSDQRFEVHKVGVIAKVRDVPVVQSIELRQLPFTDIAYTLALE